MEIQERQLKCIQCTSEECGPVRCRFTMQSNENYLKQMRQADAYAESKIRQAKERPQWERDLATGARDEAASW